jgi:hypothetical protein
LKNAENIDEYASQFDQFDLKVVEEIKGFYLNQLLTKHMIYVGYSVSYENNFLFGEEENEDENLEEFSIEDIDIVISTNEPHRQHGRVINERSTHYPNVSKRSSSQKQNSKSAT